MKSRLPLVVVFVTLIALLVFPGLVQRVFAQAGTLTVTPLTWNIIGLDSNRPAAGPYLFPVGARVCNTTASTLTNTTVTFNWTTANANINLETGSLNPLTIASLAAGACYDAYFNVQVTQVAAAYDTTRRYTITAVNGTISGTSPTPRELYVEHLVSQNRNSTDLVEFGLSPSTLTAVPPGGTMSLLLGETYTIRLTGSTATNGYEQLESFLTLPNTVFHVLSVSSTYNVDSSANVASPNLSLYADGCVWVNDPNSPYYRSCTATGKAGGSPIVNTYTVKIIGGAGSTKTLNTLLYDFSGSSYHYNSDFSSALRFATIIDTTASTISKAFTPSSISSGGISTLTFTLKNSGATTLSGYNFTDPLPTGVTVASTPNATTSGCGTPTWSPAGGATSLSFSSGTIAAGGTCTLSVQVTSTSVAPHTNTSSHLFINTVDTGSFATADLTVTAVPAAPSCVTGTIAQWTFATGSSVTSPTPSTGSGTATAGSGFSGTDLPTIGTDRLEAI